MKWQGRTGLVVGMALVVAAGLVMPGKNAPLPEDLEPSEAPVASAKKEAGSGAFTVSRPAREPVPTVTHPR